MPAFLKNKWLWIGLVLVVIAGVGVTAFTKNQEAKKAEAAEAAKKKVVSPYAAIANGKVDVEGGIIQVAARRGGVVKEVLVQEGERVVAGQILARQEDDEARLGLERARADVAQAQAQIAVMQVKLDAARREYKRLEALIDNNFVARQKIDQQRDQIRDGEAQIAAQRAAIATHMAALRTAEYALEQTFIRAPTAGRIARRYANPGAGASTLNVSTMFDLEPDAPRIARAEIVESDIPNIQSGQQVEIQPEGDPSKTYVGKVLRRAAVFGARKLASDDPSQRSDERVVEVVVTADNTPLLIGQRVLVKFMKPGKVAGAQKVSTQGVPADRAMKTPAREK
ncbi:HlyD family secretion protein [Caulobacter mirabilis]|uniref:Hemolysin secretion protein D n=1 Tax=Caulobacter mirabilis TaxID=69666 RepID=A0A2D2AWL4_9CAUL|nr:HlyD family efflux transporter periplasmic adaptor subunit [Caulobacter mirabilis]ATQ42337.1 hemolysin secretion protein D [Caulobacter mirabilis]